VPNLKELQLEFRHCLYLSQLVFIKLLTRDAVLITIPGRSRYIIV